MAASKLAVLAAPAPRALPHTALYTAMRALAAARRARAKAVEASRLHDGSRRGGRRVRAVAVGVPRRQVVALEFILGHARAVEARADDLAPSVVAAPALSDLAHTFPP